ncbi:hypothetical protein J7354_15925 [Sulfitobacter sp. R18_2]|nr:hypothetical protein [Sulfitobacter sp. R18_2]
MFSTRTMLGISTAALLISAGSAIAGDLIYKPLVPAFGGTPDNWGYLLGTAQIQNQHLPPTESGGSGGAPDITFPPIVIDLGGVGSPSGSSSATQSTDSAGTASN